MWEASLSGLESILRPDMFCIIFIGVILGTICSLLPGVGSTAMLTMAIPFAVVLGPYGAIALMMSINAVSSSGGTITAVLTGIPGHSSGIATIIEGYPMTKRGMGARAIGAGLTASMVGGLIGAVALTASLPIFRPLVEALGAPEYFMFTMWGISMIVMLSGKAPLKGALAAVLGIYIMMVGLDTKSGAERWVFGEPYLWDGIEIILPALGIFAVPEAINFAVKGGSIAEQRLSYGAGLLDGIKDVFRNWFLVIRASLVGIWVGFIPGLGGPIASWVALGDARASSRGKGDWDRGEVRGVIAPEATNNATEGSTMIPTLCFGIPGSTSAALCIIAFLAVGILPGPEMLRGQLHFTFAIIWTLVIAQLIAGLLCLSLVRPISQVAFLPHHSVVPLIIVLVFLGAFSSNYRLADILLLLIFSTVGFFMRRFNWPRAPLLLGAVLAPIMEKYLWLSHAHYGATWLVRPWVIVIFCLIVFTAGLIPLWELRQKKKGVVREKDEVLKSQT